VIRAPLARGCVDAVHKRRESSASHYPGCRSAIPAPAGGAKFALVRTAEDAKWAPMISISLRFPRSTILRSRQPTRLAAPIIEARLRPHDLKANRRSACQLRFPSASSLPLFRAPVLVIGPLEQSRLGGAIAYRGEQWEIDRATVSVVRGERKRLLKVFLKTQGHCHFCGDEIDFDKARLQGGPGGRWEEDHVIQRAKRGPLDKDNLLPACTRCNRLRSSKSGASLRRILFLGLIARDEAYEKPGSKIGESLRDLRIKRLADNYLRGFPVSQRPSAAGLESLKANLAQFENRALKLYRSELRRRQAERRKGIAHLDAGDKKPRRVSVSWSKVLEEVRKDANTPATERIPEETLRE
jgi:HNH endonuclease